CTAEAHDDVAAYGVVTGDVRVRSLRIEVASPDARRSCDQPVGRLRDATVARADRADVVRSGAVDGQHAVRVERLGSEPELEQLAGHRPAERVVERWTERIQHTEHIAALACNADRVLAQRAPDAAPAFSLVDRDCGESHHPERLAVHVLRERVRAERADRATVALSDPRGLDATKHAARLQVAHALLDGALAG